MYDLIIRNGKIINGKNEAPYFADIGIKDDNIVKIGKIDEKVEREIDAEGKIITPGFIDIHCHSDGIILSKDKNPKRLQQGFTTEIVGNCGVSLAPTNKETLDELKKYNDPFFKNMGITYEWDGFNELLGEMEANNPILNVGSYVGHGTLRIAIVGFDDKNLDEEELDNMKKILDDSLKQGAFGMSSGLIYPPGIFATSEEIYELLKVVKANEGLYATHMRSESNRLIESVEETIELAEKTGVNTLLSHHKAAGIANHGKTKTTLKMVEDANKKGLNVNVDVYPYEAASTQFSAVLPPWTLQGGVNKLIERLNDEEIRKKIIKDIKDKDSNYENFYQLSGWDKILINECSVEKYIGKTIEEIAEENNRDPFEMALDIIKESKNSVMMIVFFMSEEDVSRTIFNEYSIISTDGIPSFGKYHPRYMGSFIRVLEKYVKEEGLLSLPRAISKMTKMPANKLGIKDRGTVEEGMKADILVLDYDGLKDNSDFMDHDFLASGIDYVIINGEIGVVNGEYNGLQNGKVLRRSNKV